MRRTTFLLLTLLITIFACDLPSPPSVISVGCDVTELIDAINTANNIPASTQTLELATDCVYMLTDTDNYTFGQNALPVITSSIIIHGNNATIFRSAVGGIPYFRFFFIDGNGSLTLENIRLSNGDITGSDTGLIGEGGGGAILASGELIINDSVIANNSAVSGGGIYNYNQPATITGTDFPDNEAGHGGGAIQNFHASLSVTNSTFSSNHAGHSGYISGFGGAIFAYSEASITTLTGCEFSDNHADRAGGAIRVAEGGWLEITDSNIINNTADLNGGGLSVTSDAIASLNNVTFSGNQAEKGGGIENGHNGGQTTISGGTISNNVASMQGGGIYNKDSMAINGSTISLNNAPGGGGIFNHAIGELAIITSNILNNTASQTGGGIHNFGQTTVEETTISGNQAQEGGGLDNAGNLSIVNTTFVENTAAESGGGIFNLDSSSFLAIINSTLSGNTVTTIRGPAIYHLEGNLEISYTTITNNSGGTTNGAIFAIPSTVTISNSIIATNPSGDCSFPAGVTINDANLDSDGSCLGFTITDDPNLGPLADNGGPTFTHALLTGSPAYDAALGACPATDQRSVLRPHDVACDIGAYEDAPPIIVEPIFPGPQPYVLELTLCWVGPGPGYETVSSLQPGTQVEILGTGEGGGFIVVNNPIYNRACWVEEDDIDPDGFDLSNAPVHARPPLASDTPSIGEPPPSGCWVPDLTVLLGKKCVDPCPDSTKYPEPCSP
jgi:hypothetical protein